jgi:hypothetical protein
LIFLIASTIGLLIILLTGNMPPCFIIKYLNVLL